MSYMGSNILIFFCFIELVCSSTYFSIKIESLIISSKHPFQAKSHWWVDVLEYIRVVSLSWVGFLAQAGGLIGACLGFSFISLVEIVYWFIIRFCRLSKREKKMEQELAKKQSANDNDLKEETFENVLTEEWEQQKVLLQSTTF